MTKKRRKYTQIRDGQWFAPRRKGHRLMCCDCGLVHVVDFAVLTLRNGGKKIAMRAFRDNRATANARRHRRK